MEKITRYTIIFIVLMLLQMLIFNNIPAIGMISPYIYLVFILLLPVNMSKTLVLLLGFFSGLLIDVSVNSLGVHASATVMMAAVRPTVLNILAPRIGYESNNIPLLATFGTAWALKYITSCVAVHHITLYICFTFTFSDLGFMFLRMLINICLTVFVIMLSEIFVFKR
ncbi:MAG: rod shape-determining protein MreD [Bacteroidales bacterium]|nr:rod shape-determining protein MreD [Bacteroidales bacterium]